MLLSLLLVPLAGALLVSSLQGRRADVAASVVAFITAGLALASVPWTGKTVGSSLTWQPMPGFAFGLSMDGLGALLSLVVTLMGLGIVIYSTGYFSLRNQEHPSEDGKGRYYFFMLLFVTAMLGIAMSQNFFQVFLFWELTTVCSWALISHYGSPDAIAAGLKAMAITQFASLFFIGGLVILYTGTGSFAFDAAAKLAPGARTAFTVMMLVAAWGKAAQVPLFTWLPSAMAAPTPASAFLHAAAMVKAGIFLAARILVSAGLLTGGTALLAGAGGLITLYVGLAGYFYADDLKRLLAFSTIANLALMLVGIALGGMGSVAGLEGGLLHLWSHAFTKTLLFLCVGAFAWATGIRSISKLSGIAKTMPLTATAFLVGALGISGMPPFGIFWSKLLILRAALQVGGAWGWTTLVLVLVESALSMAWFLSVTHRVLFGETSEIAATGSDPSPAMRSVLVGLMVASVVAPYLGMPLIQWIARGVS
ncbi:MAG TPA: hydrogenase 4 subunit D [Symbiobacteriaceae bacterium]|jgi:hydrogenase-4 component D